MKSKSRKHQGFTIAEVLVVLGILSIVFSIGALSVVHYKEALKLTEMDRMAKEIFIVAQNNMLMAKDSTKWKELLKTYEDELDIYLGHSMKEKPADYPSNEVWGEEGHDYRYISYNGESSVNALEQTLLEVILPYGSIDEAVRKDGSYIIEYDYETATVYGVFYTDSHYGLNYDTDIMGTSGLNHNKGRENSDQGKTVRKKYKNDQGSMIIGYYGGAITKEFKPTPLDPIKMDVHNGDILQVTIEDENYGKVIDGVKAKTKLRLTVTGEESKASETYILQIDETSPGINTNQEGWWKATENQGMVRYTLILDDITKPGGHFADLFPKLIPGENIIVQAEAFSQEVLCTPVKAQVYTNSLFETNYSYKEDKKEDEEKGQEELYSKVSISSIRHLQNLSPEVSNLPTEVTPEWAEQKIERVVKKVEQTSSLDWEKFNPNKNHEEENEEENEEVTDINIYAYDKEVWNQKELAQNKFYGIKNTALVAYDGKNHSLSHFSIQENESGNAGLFSEIGGELTPQHFTITNVILDAFTSESQKEGNAGSLIGEVKQQGTLEVNHIFVNNSIVKVFNNGNAGGLIGEVKQQGTLKGNNIFITNATVKALNKGNAGGLVGKMSNGILNQCGIYLTDDKEVSSNRSTGSKKYELGAYHQETNKEGSQFMIASSGGAAGGLVGTLGEANITDTFAAVPVIASANGVAGGLIGEHRGSTSGQTTITNSHTGGYTKEGAYSEYYSVSALGTEGAAGGFIGRAASDKISINNSYSTASAYGSHVGGFIGIIEKGENTYKNCYATGKVTGVNESSKRDGFIGEVKAANTLLIDQCYFLKQSNKGLAGTISGVQGLDYDEFIKAIGGTSEQGEQHVYDTALETESYPFRMVTKLGAKSEAAVGVHHGDWPIKSNEISAEGDIGVIYYELVEDKLYYHGYFATYSEKESEPNYQEVMTRGAGLTNGLLTTPGKYVSEDGYMILVPEGTDLSKIAVTASNTRDYLEGERWTLSQCVEPFSKSHLFDLEGFDMYYFKRELNNYESAYLMIGENIDQHYPVLGKYVAFYFNHYFGDTVAPERPTDQKVYIRSARQLANLNKLNWSHANNKEIEFVQNIDISYEDIVFTKNGTDIVYEYQTLGQIYSDYTAGQYKSEDELQGYVIKGLKVPLFGRVESSSTIKGVTLINSQVKANASFANTNAGVIESCSVHAASPGQDSYTSVTVENQYGTAGFVQTNGESGGKGIIRNSYFVGTVTGETSSGFVDTNYGIIENSYANVIVRGNTSASGFVRSNINGTIKNSFVTGSIISTGEYGKAYGFMELGSEGIMENCYSALFQLSGHQIYRFGPGRGLHYSNTVWLNNTYVEGDVQAGNPNDLSERGTAVSYETMAQKATNPKTYRYKSNYEYVDKREGDIPYPFELLSTEDAYLKMAFWGDWPEEDLTREIGLLYYEKTYNTLEYKGYIATYRDDESEVSYPEVFYKEIKSGVAPNKTSSKGGYIILVKEGTDPNSIHIRIKQNSGDNESGQKPTFSECKPVLVEKELLHIVGFEAYYVELKKNNGKLPETDEIELNYKVNRKFL